MSKMRRRVGILISGRGSNMSALIEAARAPDYPAEIVVVISNEPEAAGLKTARANAIPAEIINHRDFTTREEFGEALDAKLRNHNVEIVCLAGFMRLLATSFVERWHGRIVNIHPSLLPNFKGLNTHARALAAGAKVHGCTVHFVEPELDSGPTILQAEVPVLPGDDERSLAARVLAEEHRIYPEALRLVAEGRAVPATPL
jgi:phosphoribosylglycinamide formyltransferase-1